VNNWTALELDPIPAAIAQYFHPTETIYNKGFKRTSLPSGNLDLAIAYVGEASPLETRYP
jgi:hypothetical protein